MKRLNNKGFAISTIIYSVLIIAILVMAMLYSALVFRKKTESDFVDKVEDELNNIDIPCSVSSFSVGKTVICGNEKFVITKVNSTTVDTITEYYLDNNQNRQSLDGTPTSFSDTYYWLLDTTGASPEIKTEYSSTNSFPLNLPLKVNNQLDSNNNLSKVYDDYQTYLRSGEDVKSAVVTWFTKDDMASLGVSGTTEATNADLKNVIKSAEAYWLGTADYITTTTPAAHRIYVIYNGKIANKEINSTANIRAKVTISKSDIKQ